MSLPPRAGVLLPNAEVFSWHGPVHISANVCTD